MSAQGCTILQPLDIEVGAGTFHPATFLRAMDLKIGIPPMYSLAGGLQMDVMVKILIGFNILPIPSCLETSPKNIQQIYLDSLAYIGIDTSVNDIRFVEDNWESPTLGAWGLGWEVWINGMEVTQFTYFQQVGGLECSPVTGEITYGLERLAMYLQEVESIYDLVWSINNDVKVTYGDVFQQNEIEMSAYNFEHANTDYLFKQFDQYEDQSNILIKNNLPLPAYEMVIKASHIFNLLDARHAISVTERQRFILRVRTLARAVAENYYQARAAPRVSTSK